MNIFTISNYQLKLTIIKIECVALSLALQSPMQSKPH